MVQQDRLMALLGVPGVEQFYEEAVDEARAIVRTLHADDWQHIAQVFETQAPEWQERLLYLIDEKNTGQRGIPLILAALHSPHPDVALAAVDALVDHPSFRLPKDVFTHVVSLVEDTDPSSAWVLEHLRPRVISE